MTLFVPKRFVIVFACPIDGQNGSCIWKERKTFKAVNEEDAKTQALAQLPQCEHGWMRPVCIASLGPEAEFDRPPTKMKKKSSIPPGYWTKAVRVCLDDLTKTPTKKRKRSTINL